MKNWSVVYPDGRSAVLAPAYDFVSTMPYIPEVKLALTFGRSDSLGEISLAQVRRFTDTARIPMDPVWRIVRETAERTAEAWGRLWCRELLPGGMLQVIGEQIGRVAGGTARQR